MSGETKIFGVARRKPTQQQASSVVHLAVHVQPGASRTEIAGMYGSAVKIRLHAKAQDGAANKALLRFLAEILDVPPSHLEIVHGTNARDKIVAVHTVEAGRVEGVIRQLAAGRRAQNHAS